MATNIDLKALLSKAGLSDDINIYLQYESVFDEADTDKSGQLDRKEFEVILQKCKKADKLELFFRYCDQNSDGCINKLEYFKGLMGLDVKEAWENVFRQADTNNSGTLNTTELLKLLKETNCGSNYSDEDMKRFISQNDIDNDGELDYNEFIEKFIQGRTLE